MKVKVYGADHSPWVQAVLLGLHERGIEHEVLLLPPRAVFRKWGVLMPAVSIDGRLWEIDSTKILEKFGFAPVSQKELRLVQNAWQSVLQRPNNPFRFFSSFAKIRNNEKSIFKRYFIHLGFSFICFYMFVLINFLKFAFRPKQPVNYGDQFLYWEQSVADSDGPFLDGTTPGTRDMLLFGIVQCHASIPVAALQALRHDERLDGLRQWIGHMQMQFRDHQHLYSGAYFAPLLPRPKPATAVQRVIFYIGLLTLFALFPLTLFLVFVLMKRVPRQANKRTSLK
tara:strand:- start:2232 stop:3080 length:849 start_codon:yes stop_codon:yes gene_type:complete